MWGGTLPVVFDWRPMFPGAALPAVPRPMHHQVLNRRDPRLLRHVLSRSRSAPTRRPAM